MILVLHSVEMAGNEAAQENIELAKKMFKHEKETFGQDVIFMRAATGKTNRVFVGGFFESHAAHEEYLKKLFQTPERQEMSKSMKQEGFVPGSWETNYYRVIEY